MISLDTGAVASGPFLIVSWQIELMLLCIVLVMVMLCAMRWRGRARRMTQANDQLIQADRSRKLLMQELDHRVKNNLAAVMSLAEQTAAVSDDIEQFRKAFLGRLRAMTQAHEALARARWSGSDLRTLAALTLATHLESNSPQVQLDGDPVMLPARATLPVSLVLNELSTNAVKYGALSNPQGRVTLRWSRDDAKALRIEWTEACESPIESPRHVGMGTRLMRGLIEYELQGKLELSFGVDGLCCIILLS